MKFLKLLFLVFLILIPLRFTVRSIDKQNRKRLKIAFHGLVNQMTGIAGTNLKASALEKVKFEKISLPNTIDKHSSIAMGPDGKLYASTLDGRIKRFSIKADGTLNDPEIIYSLQHVTGKKVPRLTIGLTFDPSATADSLVVWVTHSTYIFGDGPDWDGKLTRLSGPNLEKVQDVLVNLPRSAKDHLTNSIAFGPDGALYFTQGSNTAMGGPDKTWQYREEHLLSGAVLRLDPVKLKTVTLPLNVRTSDGGNYNPFAPHAPLTIFATGIRNAYDLLWHSNGELYVPTNGSDAGGNTPASLANSPRIDGSLYAGPIVHAIAEVNQVMPDFLFRVEKGGYYGHPNPTRGEFVMNGGNPTANLDPAQLDQYPVGTLPDSNWRGFAFAFSNHNSPNGVIEYKGSAFNGILNGKILVVRLINNMDIMVLEPGGAKKDIVKSTEGVAIPGFWNFFMPIDLTEDVSTGNIYVSEYGGEGQIILLRPLSDNSSLLTLNNKPY